MAFKTNYMTKYDQLNRFAKQQKDPTTKAAGASSRERTKKMLALGQAQAEQTKASMQSSAQGVKRIFNQSDIGGSRERSLAPDLDMASWIQGIEEEASENKPEEVLQENSVTERGTPLVDFDEGKIEFAMGALSDVESRGSGGYSAVGPVVRKGMYQGQRAYGKYQVMEGNIGPWTKKYYGTKLTAQEFVNNPEAQDTVVENLLMSNWEKYGSIEDAVSVWFTGRPVKKGSKSSDGSITGLEYLDRWKENYVRRRDEELGDN